MCKAEDIPDIHDRSEVGDNDVDTEPSQISSSLLESHSEGNFGTPKHEADAVVSKGSSSHKHFCSKN